MDGAGAFSTFFYITLPHLARPITVVILIETIFLLTVFAEIFVTTGGGPGLQTTNIAFLIYSQALHPIRRRRRLGRRPRRGGARQHRRLLPDPHRRPEPGGLSDGTTGLHHAHASSPRPRPGSSAS